jgi:TonB family protein
MGPLLLLVSAGLLLAADGGETRRGLVLTGTTATPIREATWIDPIQDYPARARRNLESGAVVARVFVIGRGRVAGCLILQGSGIASLESATCRILRARAQFVPFAGGGLATYDYRIVWDLSRLPPLPIQNLTTYRD